MLQLHWPLLGSWHTWEKNMAVKTDAKRTLSTSPCLYPLSVTVTTFYCTIVLSSLPFQLKPVSCQRLSISHFTACTAFWWITRGSTSHQATYWHCFLEEILSLDLESQQNWNHGIGLVIAELPIWCYNLQAMLQGHGQEWLMLPGRGKCISTSTLRVTTIIYGHTARVRGGVNGSFWIHHILLSISVLED